MFASGKSFQPDLMFADKLLPYSKILGLTERHVNCKHASLFDLIISDGGTSFNYNPDYKSLTITVFFVTHAPNKKAKVFAKLLFKTTVECLPLASLFSLI